ncbi:Crp/Fnr family transcriptional regulator [Carboxylicivirga linearis]|uniref:Crp/Fnr family transcriptional regulator n=1 Tax=Carboxylicivirga linearis TaxID=1628157 RepID=A0ABS5JP82_9BACT|nr:Crp/Fnr family transcriptional regulator [Carboxylicivirga linearis]MBS2096639.1 Crp/Fnr family transcriptional regulator [Carboxylicivirga linearis]
MEQEKSLQETSECFKFLSDEELKILKDKKARIIYLKGENVMKQGAFATHVLFVVDGLVRVYLQTAGTKQINLQLKTQGDFLAFSSVFGEEVYPYSAVAMKDSIICMVDKDALKDLLVSNPEFGLKITSRNYQIENRYLEIISNISYKQMRGKLASTLIYLSTFEAEGVPVFEHMSRQDIADFASITSESTIKFLKEFEKDQIIKLDGRQINIINMDSLKMISKNS